MSLTNVVPPLGILLLRETAAQQGMSITGTPNLIEQGSPETLRGQTPRNRQQLDLSATLVV